MKLINILKNIDYELVKGNINIDINNIETDSRNIKDKYLFIPQKHFNKDGHDYIKDAINNGASAILISKNVDISKDITVIKVNNTNKILSKLSMNFFNYPQNKLKTIAITGTKGKTTTSFMIKKIIEVSNHTCGVIGTTGIYINDIYYKTENTTPEAYKIFKYMNEMVKNKIEYLVIEVSSQALKYDRVNDIVFDYAIFTNLTKDHISEFEHDSMEDYIKSKSKLFKQSKQGIYNIDDSHFHDMISKNEINTFGYDEKADLRGKKLELIKKEDFLGIKLTTTGVINDTFEISVPGIFSSYNAMAAILACYKLGIDIKYIKEALKKFSVKGRIEQVKVSDKYTLLIDYAHNGISTESILTTIKAYNPKRIVTIFGCGGNRSKDRRYEMGKMASKYSNFCIITEDNNRYEAFEDILKDILKYYDKLCPYKIIPERKEAIRYAIKNGRPGDVIMLLGKGHEDYIEVLDKKIPFDERIIIKEILEEEKKR